MRYVVWTLVLGLFAVPLGIGLWTSFAVMFLMNTGAWLAWGVAALSLVGVFAIWYRWGRVRRRPATAWGALLPVMAVPAYFLVAWMISFAVAPGNAVQNFSIPGIPWFLVSFWAAMTGEWVVVPVTLAGVMAATLSGFALGYRRRRRVPENTGWAARSARIALTGTLAVTLALIGVPAFQAGTYLRYLAIPQVSDEVDLFSYAPFVPGNKLVVPATRPTLQLTGSYPRLDGATALYPVYAAVAQAVYVFPDPVTQATRYVECNKTGGAYDRLIAGQVDAIFVAQPSSQQRTAAAAAGVDLTLTPVGREAFVFFVNADNPIDGLTLQQVRDIYTKTVTNWRQLGGPDEPIQAFQRPEGSGSQTAMLAQVMRDTPMAEPQRDEVAGGMGEVINQVATYRNTAGAIGYTFRWYATVMNANPGIKLLTIDGVAPTAENIRNGTYPLSSDFYVVTAGEPQGTTRQLVDWLVGPEGQSLIGQVGYVPK